MRSAIFFKAVGVKRFFHYEGLASSSGYVSYRRETNIVDVDGTPQPSVAAFAAMVSFLEGTQALGFDIVELDAAEPRVARFERAGQAISVVWSRAPVALKSLPNLNLNEWNAFDMMGNPIENIQAIELSLAPIYLLSNTQL